jgi:hypothetical protein
VITRAKWSQAADVLTHKTAVRTGPDPHLSRVGLGRLGGRMRKIMQLTRLLALLPHACGSRGQGFVSTGSDLPTHASLGCKQQGRHHLWAWFPAAAARMNL